MKSNNEVNIDDIPTPKRGPGRPKGSKGKEALKFIGVRVTVKQAEMILKLHGKYSKGIREIVDFYMAEHQNWEPSQNITGESD